MADYAGAVAAIKARFVSLWVDAGKRRTPIAFQNEAPNDGADPPAAIVPWPPVGLDASVPPVMVPIPWVYFEVIGSTSALRGAGTPGDQLWSYWGHIFVHVYVPDGYGVEAAQQLAVMAGEIFRAQSFYADGQGRYVRTGIGPGGQGIMTDGGASDADVGNWFRVTCTIPFEYFHRG